MIIDPVENNMDSNIKQNTKAVEPSTPTFKTSSFIIFIYFLSSTFEIYNNFQGYYMQTLVRE